MTAIHESGVTGDGMAWRSRERRTETWGICTRRAGKLCSARSLLYRRLRLREWAHFLAFFAIYKIFTPSHRSELKISEQNCHIFSYFLQEILKILQIFIKFSSNFAGISRKFHENFTEFAVPSLKFRSVPRCPALSGIAAVGPESGARQCAVL